LDFRPIAALLRGLVGDFRSSYKFTNSYQRLPEAPYLSQDAAAVGGSEMSGQLGIVEKAREELRKQFWGYAERLSKGFQRGQTYDDVEGITKIGAAIDALDKVIAAEHQRVP
jgi:hypothetical protein